MRNFAPESHKKRTARRRSFFVFLTVAKDESSVAIIAEMEQIDSVHGIVAAAYVLAHDLTTQGFDFYTRRQCGEKYLRPELKGKQAG